MKNTVDRQSTSWLAALILLMPSALAIPDECLETTENPDEFVGTTSGQFLGTIVTFRNVSVRQFLGIPYALPPVGDLRFKKPEILLGNSQNPPFIANTRPPACIQYAEQPLPWYDNQDNKSEDCLYMNIWAPMPRNDTLPVMVWIYGGEFAVGSNRMDVYDGRALAAVGEIIVVTFNYRMNALGFLTSGTEEAPGNVGMYDIQMALEWVSTNIHQFGGHKYEVTLAGQGSGAVAIGLLCVSPLTRNLFQRVIMQSGSPAYLLAENNKANIAISQRIAKEVGCADDNNTIEDNPQEVVSCLREKDAMLLARTVNSFRSNSFRLFLPSYGDELLPKNARKALVRRRFRDVDVFIGNNFHDGYFLLTSSHPDEFGFHGEKPSTIQRSGGELLLRDFFDDFGLADREIAAITDYYLPYPEENSYYYRQQTATAISDFCIECPSVYFANSYANKNNSVYFYFFDNRPSHSPWAEWMETVHFDEVPFVFGVPLRKPEEYTDEERKLSERMMKLWSNFVKRGVPDANWTKYTVDDQDYYDITPSGLVKGVGSFYESCNFLSQLFEFNF